MKINSILGILDKKTQSKLRRYLNSEYFCTDPQLPRLYDILLKDLKQDEETIKRNAWNELFGKQAYADVKMRLLMSRLVTQIENFIGIEYKEDTPFNLSHLRLYRHKSEDKLFLQILEEQKKFQEKSPLRNETYYERSYSLGLEEYDFLVNKKRQGDFNLRQISDSIEISYAIKKLRHCCRVLQIHSIYKLETLFPYIEETLRYIETNEWFNLPVLGFYYYNYQSIINPLDVHYFNRCFELYELSEEKFEEEERRYAFIDILNYCIRKLNEGSDKYYDIIFNLYNRGLNQGFLIDQGKLSRFTFRNIAEIGIQIKEYQWVLDFLDKYKIFVEKKYRDSFYQLEKARVLSDQRNYDKANSLLANLSFSDPMIELSTRLERIRIFYETDEIDLCHYHVESMDLFLRRKKNIGYHTAYYKNFLSYVRKLVRPELSEYKYWKTLRQQLDNEDKITSRKWLIEKLENKMSNKR
ncbi:MAG: hypothetical protein HOP11_05300 [Saprospiraceae bacterium]|nr:hypothetical protein [Saprospiraceae bacterium]